MSPRRPRRPIRHAAVVALGCVGLAGCVDELDLSSRVEKLDVTRHLDTELDHPRTIVEKALASCGSRAVAAETACVRQAVDAANLDVARLIALLPGCAMGKQCQVDYATEDKIGFVGAVASDYRVTWRVTFDLTKRPTTVGGVPIKVEQVG